MSLIHDLVAELCPHGVQFKELGIVAQIASARAGAAGLDVTTYVGVDNLVPNFGGRKDSDYAPNSSGAIGFGAGDVLIGNIRPYLKKVWLADRDGGASPDVLVISLMHDWRDAIVPRFLYLNLASGSFIDYLMRNARGAKMPRGDKAAALNYRIPVPPLEVQREIVRILDNFAELEAALEAELEARRRQYAFYRHQILTGDAEAPRVPLGELAIIGTGSHDTKDAIPNGNHVFYARGRDPLRLDLFDFDERAIITAGDGAGVGKVFHFADGKYALHQRAYRIVPGVGLNARYIYHYLVMDFERYLEQTSVHGSVASLRRPMFVNYTLPVPAIEEQHRIADILDNFDALINDLNIGLPAELAARRKQYEYYRDKLLTFEEAPS